MVQLTDNKIYGYSYQRYIHETELSKYFVNYTIEYATGKRMAPPVRTYRVTDIVTNGLHTMNKVTVQADVSVTGTK